MRPQAALQRLDHDEATIHMQGFTCKTEAVFIRTHCSSSGMRHIAVRELLQNALWQLLCHQIARL